jgi:hypothetical protein
VTLYAPGAIDQIDRLREHYVNKQRYEAAEALNAALDEAESWLETKPERGLPAPRPYPRLVRPGWLWMKASRYWVAYTDTRPPMILAVFFEEADIPSRL